MYSCKFKVNFEFSNFVLGILKYFFKIKSQ